MEKVSIGRYLQQTGGYKAFTPYPFPPKDGFIFSPKLYKKHEEAVRLIGKLDGVTRLLPDKDFFLLMFIKKDATSSSQIEGTKATFQDAVVFDIEEEKKKLPPDVDDIVHYLIAVNYAIERIKEFPLSLRFICEIHLRLMKGARSTQHAYPGEFRVSQNWIGAALLKDATFVPPAPKDMNNSLSDLESFIHSNDEYPNLIKAGLLHSQFETIHPFADGNGRTGRMLITLFLHHSRILETPVLYLSSYFKKHQKLYYENLGKYHSEDGNIEDWLNFFLDGVIDTAKSSIGTCDNIVKIRERDMRKIQGLGKTEAPKTLEVVKNLFAQPIIGVAEIKKWTGYTLPGAYKMIKRLVDMKILEMHGAEVSYGQKYIYADYYEIFDEVYAEKRNRK
jgi:Fic family protein